jgi:isocitrate dehydrogenase
LAAQKDDAEIAASFNALATTLVAAESKIVEELIAVQGKPVDVGGYYYPNAAKVEAAMRPSATLNQALASLGK